MAPQLSGYRLVIGPDGTQEVVCTATLPCSAALLAGPIRREVLHVIYQFKPNGPAVAARFESSGANLEAIVAWTRSLPADKFARLTASVDAVVSPSTPYRADATRPADGAAACDPGAGDVVARDASPHAAVSATFSELAAQRCVSAPPPVTSPRLSFTPLVQQACLCASTRLRRRASCRKRRGPDRSLGVARGPRQ